MASSPIWKSSKFWAFVGVSGSFAGGIAYDRFNAKQLFDEFMAEARKYGQLPILEGQQPQCISLFALTADSDAAEALKTNFKSYSVKLLTAAGIDYAWAVAIDPEQVTKEWNRAAQDANTPEKMLDEGKRLEGGLIREQLLNNSLLVRLGRQVQFSDTLWSSIQAKLVQKPFWSPNFVALNQSTLTTLSESLAEIKAEPFDVPEEPTPKRSWFSRTQPVTKIVDPSLLHLDAINLRLLNCEQPMSFKHRVWRYLFGQTELVRELGTPTMSLIRSLNSDE